MKRNLDYFMFTLDEIEKAINRLSSAEFWELTDRLIEKREAMWDAQIEADEAAAHLYALWEKAENEIIAGKIQSLDSFLDDPR